MKQLFIALLLWFSTGTASAADDMQIYRAIEMDNVSTVRKAIQSGSHNVNSKLAVPPYQAGPMIMFAGKDAALEVLEFLIENRADLNAQSETGDTALMLAAFVPDSGDINSQDRTYDRHVNAVKMLLDAGANLENGPGQYSALAYAAYAKHPVIVELLLERGAHPDSGAVMPANPVNTPLIMAAMSGDDESAELLLRAGANPHIVNSHNRSALHYALKAGNNDILQKLKCAIALKDGERYATSCR